MADNDLPWITSESCFSAFIGEDGGLSYLPPPSVPTDLEVALHCNQDSLRQVPLAAQVGVLYVESTVYGPGPGVMHCVYCALHVQL